MTQEYDTDDLYFACMISKAESMSLLSFIHEICQHIGFENPDNLSVEERFYRERRGALESLFRSLEDGNPALAARLFGRYEAARKGLGDERS